MKILKNTIVDISNDFTTYEESFNGCNYNVYFIGKTFKYENKDTFTEQNLKEIFDDRNDINGDIKLIKWESAFSEISKNLRYTSYDKGFKEPGEVLNFVFDNDHKKRIDGFLNMIKQYINIPPQIVYEHQASYSSYFDNYVMWGLCYIFLSKDKGLVLHIYASD